MPTSISAATAREEQDLVPGSPPVVKVQACLCKSAHNKHGIIDVYMVAFGDHIPALTVGRTTISELNGC